MGRFTRPRVHVSTQRLHARAMDALHPPPVFRAPRMGDGPSALGRGDFNDIFQKLSDPFALFSIFLIYRYKSETLFC